MRKLSLVLPLVSAISSVAVAQEIIQLQGTEITGNKESPNVLYIVPWKSVEHFEIEAPPIDSILDQPLTAVDRAAFRRTINYHEAIFHSAEPELTAGAE